MRDVIEAPVGTSETAEGACSGNRQVGIMNTGQILEILQVADSCAVLVCRADERMTGVTDAAVSLLQRPRDELLQQSVRDVLELQAAPTSLCSLAATGAVHQAVLSADRREVSVRVAAVPDSESLYLISLHAGLCQSAANEDQRLLQDAEAAAQIGSFVWDARNNSLTWSDGLLKIYGLQPTEFAGTFQAFMQRVHPEDQARIQQSLDDAAGNGGNFRSAERILRPNGEVRWLESQGRLQIDANGRPLKLVGICRDVTDQTQNEHRLKSQVQALEQLSQCAAAMFSRSLTETEWAPLLRSLGRIVGADAFSHLLNVGDQLRLVAQEGVPSEFARRLKKTPEETLCGRAALTCSEIYLPYERLRDEPFGRELTRLGVRTFFAVPLLMDGESLGAVAFGGNRKLSFSSADRNFLRLVAQVVAAAQSRRIADQQRETDRYRYQQTAVHSRMVVWEVDARNWDFSYVSDFCEQLTGHSREEWLSPGFWERTIHPDDREAASSYCRFETEQKRNHRLEYRMVCRDGRTIWIDDVVEVVVKDDFVVGLRGTLMDITERKSLQEQLLQAQKMEAIGRLSSGVAHDFNNLLTVILGACELMQLNRSKAVGQPEDRLLKSISDAAERAARLTSQLLLFSRVATDTCRIVLVSELIREISELLERLLGRRYPLSIVIDAEDSLVKIDPTHLEQVVINLVVNARDAMPDGGPIEVYVGCRDTGPAGDSPESSSDRKGSVVLKVTDQGMGIEDEARAQLFEPFYTTKPAGQGTGLGLAVVYGIVRGAGGVIEVDSQVGKGTCFTICLPRVATNLVPGDGQQSLDNGKSGCTILLVHDYSQVMDVIAESLRLAGYRVLDSAGPVELVDQLSSETVNLVIAEVPVTGEGVRDIAPVVHGVSHCEDLPILFVGGHDFSQLEDAGMNSKSANLLVKPFRISELMERIEHLIAGSQSF
ncbi:MAG: PAS domain-containing protein [Planctomycetaceae bacterium]